MALRQGGFGVSLDPFGGGRGGLGRYNITGETISSLAAYEAYAVAVAWANGNATDEEYLASLQTMVDLAPEGTRERVTAENKLRDAKYSIDRNKVIDRINAAVTSAAKNAAYADLLAHEEAHLASMTATDSEAYREQKARVASVRGDIRQVRYADLLEKVNRGQASISSLLELARTLSNESQAAADPDRDEWGTTIDQLVERVEDEKLSDLMQKYQHGKVAGSAVIAAIDARLLDLAEGSPAYLQLAQTREDLADRVKREAATLRDAEVNQQRAKGTITDAEFLTYLRDSYNSEDPGTAEWVQAGTRLREYTFSLAEDKLRFDVSKGKRTVGDLINFYANYQKTMTSGSERWRELQTRIDSLRRQGGGGGGGGGRSGSGKGIELGPPLIDGKALLRDILGGQAEPPGFSDLFRINPMDTAAWAWFQNNQRSITKAFQLQARTWSYFDQRGNEYVVPFTDDMMSEMDQLGLTYAQIGVALSDSAKEAQKWVGRVLTAQGDIQTHGSTADMRSFTRIWDTLQKAKDRALAGQRFAEYEELAFQQAAMGEAFLASPYVAQTDIEQITAKLTSAAPQVLDPKDPDYNPAGDHVLAFMREPDNPLGIRRDPNGSITSVTPNPDRFYVTQNVETGRIEGVIVDTSQVRGDPVTGAAVPLYQDTHVPVKVRYDGQDVTVWQPIVDMTGDLVGAAAYRAPQQFPQGGGRAPAGRSITGAITDVGSSRVVDANGQGVFLPLHTVYTWENGKRVTWLSVDIPGPDQNGKGQAHIDTWLRYEGGPMPRIVLPPNVQFTSSGKWQIDGNDVPATEVLKLARFWSSADSLQAGEGIGGPGMSYTIRKSSSQGEAFDSRPEYIIDAEETALFKERQRYKAPRKASAHELAADQRRAGGRPESFYRTGSPLPVGLRSSMNEGLNLYFGPSFTQGGYVAQAKLGPLPKPLPVMALKAKDDLYVPPPTPTLRQAPTIKVAPLPAPPPVKLPPKPAPVTAPPISQQARDKPYAPPPTPTTAGGGGIAPKKL